MIDETLRQLDIWYREPSSGPLRPKLLSKLAVLELCGWIEEEFDKIVRDLDAISLNDPQWIESIIKKTNGFDYGDHFRPMIARILGEFSLRKIESSAGSINSSELEQLKSILGSLWRQRCSFAHADMDANIISQQTFNAPSWSVNQYKLLAKLLPKLRLAVLDSIR